MSFVSDRQELVHGNQLLSWYVSGYDSEQKYDQSSHTLTNIWSVIDQVFMHHKSKKGLSYVSLNTSYWMH